MRSPSRGSERGSVTAEFATAVPAVLLVLAGCLAGMQVAGQQLRLQDAAADAARSIARGEGAGTASVIAARAVPGAALGHSTDGDLVCVRVSAPSAPFGPLASLTLTASSCALGGGR